jgi:hypothetical protein
MNDMLVFSDRFRVWIKANGLLEIDEYVWILFRYVKKSQKKHAIMRSII